MSATNLNVIFECSGTEHRPTSYALHRGVNHWDRAEVVLNLTLEGAIFDPLEFSNKPASLSVDYTDDAVAPVCFHGTVTEAGVEDNEDGTSSMRLTIEGPLWPLRRRHQSKIYRKLTPKKIIGELLAGGSITSEAKYHGPAFDSEIEFVLQHEEYDSDFLERFLAGIGASFLVTNDAQNAIIHFIEDVQGFSDQVVETPYRPVFSEETSRESVTHVEFARRVTPDKVVMTAYDPKRPRLAIEATEQESGDSKNELYEPLGRFTDEGKNKTTAQSLLSSHLLRKQEVRGVTGNLAITPGAAINITEHPYELLNAKFLVLEVTLVGSLPREFKADIIGDDICMLEFVAVPRDVAVKLEGVPLARRVLGVQTAKTTGAPGEEIDVSKDGEVTVSFYWDRSGVTDQNASMPIRTAQLATGGAMLLPRVGWEVVVGFHEGDIDHPLVLSRLYNGKSPPPYALPEGALRSSLQTATSPGDGSSNEMRFDDTKGNEQMFFNASKDMSMDVGNNTTHHVGHDHKVTVGVDQSLTIIDSETCVVGANQTIEIGANQTVSVATLCVDDVKGNHSASVAGNEMQMIGGDQRNELLANSELTIGGNSMMAIVGSITTNCAASADLTVGAASISIVGGDRSLIVGGARSETTGAAKVMVTKGNHALEVGSLATTIGGALVAKVTGDRADASSTLWSETAGGIEKIEAEEIVIEAQGMLTLTMGASIISLNPAMASITGTNVKLDGAVVEMAPLIVTN